jgi:DNA-binding CsgD family transcriptional regulator
MDTQLFNIEANTIWKKAASNAAPEQLHIELDLYKKLLNFFQVGQYFYWVLNVCDYKLDFVSQEIMSLLGYLTSEFSLEFFMDKIHPEDRPSFLNFENRAVEFLTSLPLDKLMKYKITHDFRMKKSDGNYIRLLNQSTVIEHDENGQILRTLGVDTDITLFKSTGKPILSFIGLCGEPSYYDVTAKQIFTVSKESLTKREKQILLLLMDGKLSKEIGDLLHISKLTVDTHRNNMLTKNNLKNTGELITKAIKEGWI